MNGPNNNNGRGHTRRKPRPRRNQPPHQRRPSFGSAATNRNDMTMAFYHGPNGQAPHQSHQPYLPQPVQFLQQPYQPYLPQHLQQPQQLQLPLPPAPPRQFPTSNTLVLARPPQENHTSTKTWKSSERKEEEEYRRMRKQVRHLAPEMFKGNAEPFGESCDIFPRNVTEWKQFKSDMYGMRADELEKNAQKTLAMAEALENIPKEKRAIKSAFGDGAKVFKDGLGPVLAQPTIWSLEHGVSGWREQVPWPTQAELLCNGDNRETVDGRTRIDRCLPPPRQSTTSGVSFHDIPLVRPFPLDKTGPIFESGPSPVEIDEANSTMNNDETFEEAGQEALGAGLMEKIGEWQPPYVPAWPPGYYADGIDVQMAAVNPLPTLVWVTPEDLILSQYEG